MARKHMFVTGTDGKTRELPVDEKHLDKQIREHRNAGREVTVLDEDERIKYGLLAEKIRRTTGY
ncbi:hypothetical protein AB0875_12460 [Micromonospora gifhornensis]|uniref:hypothetical protein n=1 Tax=Micromonospora gifhornensis TaxID=84594 RepID=UPI003453ED1D